MGMTMIGLDDFLGAVRQFGQISGWSFVTSGSNRLRERLAAAGQFAMGTRNWCSPVR